MFQLACKATRCTHHNGDTWNNCGRYKERKQRDFDIVKLDDTGRCRYFADKVAVAVPGNGKGCTHQEDEPHDACCPAP